MRIFKIPLFRDSVPDEQFIARIRRGLRWQYKLRFVFLAASIVIIIMICGFVPKVIDLVDTMANADEASSVETTLLHAALVVAIVFGLVLGQTIHEVMKWVVDALFGSRTERLLVDCWDQLHPENRPNDC